MSSKEETLTIVLKSIGYFLLGTAILFVLVFTFVGIHFYRESLPVIRSDSQFSEHDYAKKNLLLRDIQYRIQGQPDLVPPENAYGLYLATGPRWLFPDIFISFRMNSKDECEALLKHENLALEKFQEGNISFEGPWQHYELPHEWSKRYQDRNWSLKEGDEFLYCEDDERLIIYVPEDNQFYICLYTGPG